MEVEAGCVLATVQQAAAAAGRLYPVSLGAEGSCQIGGTISTNAGGTGVLRYGNTRDNVLGLEVVLPDGAVWDGLYRLRKNNTGLDLKHLFIGAEGTMGIVTAAVLKLHPLPTVHAAAWLALPSPQAALQVLGLFQDSCGAPLSAFEMLDAGQVQLVLDHVPGRRAPLPTSHPWHVLVELADTRDEAGLSQRLQQVLEAAVANAWVEDAVVATSGAQRQAMWSVRHSIAEANRKAGIALTTDSAVPVSALPDVHRAGQRGGACHRARPADRDGGAPGRRQRALHPVLQPCPLAGAGRPRRAGLRIKRAVNEVCHALGGTFSAEHGVGQMLTSEMAHFKSPVELALMRALKQAVDPLGLFNPGRLLPPFPPDRVDG
jgi:FAD/FMN-containing dehydrogenase